MIKDNIFLNKSVSLIGMAGAGKSSIAAKLSEIIDFAIIDSDLLIEKETITGEELVNVLEKYTDIPNKYRTENIFAT